MPDAPVIAGCLSGEKGDAGVAALVHERPATAVLLAPLLMSLGHHARHDALEGLAWTLSAQTWPHSLAELPAVRALVVAHARKELT
ncbi:MAG: hypothetical protein Q4B91_08525 [Atopobiaceae bacterium]|nr:hypothetical protein [Atopobiaceae bacterium]